jgi:tRNA threonylcarbamoyladenosine biosynthesis protein TsaE
MIYRTASPEETIAAGREIGKSLAAPNLVLLIGDLGAGKTTLTKGIVEGRGAGAAEDVLSPTFSLMHEFGEDPKVYHLDLYRLDRLPELETLGLDDLWDEEAIVLIEWGEKFMDQWPRPRLEIRLRRLDEDSREIELTEVN